MAPAFDRWHTRPMTRDSLYPPIAPHDVHWLPACDGHRVHYQQCGNPDGVPVLLVHGGPGSRITPFLLRLLDPQRFRMIGFDQRGCGQSTPNGRLPGNDTDALIADIERLRMQLGIARWLVLGGSWGAALGIAWAGRHPDACLGAILRAPFLTGDADLRWFFDDAGALAPEAWAPLAALAADAGAASVWPWLGEAMLAARNVTDAWPLISAWATWEQTLSGAPLRRLTAASSSDPQVRRTAFARYRVQAHYLLHNGFLGEDAVLAYAEAMAALPVTLLHGTADLVCRPINSWRLQQRFQNSRLEWVDGAGHDLTAPEMVRAMRNAGERFLGNQQLGDALPD